MKSSVEDFIKVGMCFLKMIHVKKTWESAIYD